MNFKENSMSMFKLKTKKMKLMRELEDKKLKKSLRNWKD
jgi:hypothetical protein